MHHPIPSTLCLTLTFAACGSPTASTATTPTLAQLQATQVRNLAMPQPNLVTSGQPTEAQLEQLAQLGVRRVIQLRTSTESGTGWEEAKAKALGIEFVRLPVAGGDAITVANAQALATWLAASGGKTTLVCCASSNRVGALLAMKAFHVDGKPAEEALAFGRAGGLKALEPTVAEKLRR